MALRPGLRIIDPTSMPVEKMPIDRLKEAVPDATPLGEMLDMLPDTSVAGADSPGTALEQVIELIGVPNSDPLDSI